MCVSTLAVLMHILCMLAQHIIIQSTEDVMSGNQSSCIRQCTTKLKAHCLSAHLLTFLYSGDCLYCSNSACQCSCRQCERAFTAADWHQADCANSALMHTCITSQCVTCLSIHTCKELITNGCIGNQCPQQNSTCEAHQGGWWPFSCELPVCH